MGDLGNTPLHYAASRGLEEIAQKLLRIRCGSQPKNEIGQTPIGLALIMKREKVADLLKGSSDRRPKT